MEVREFIGLDVGKARTGFARGSSAARLAEPLKTIPTVEALGELKKMIGSLDNLGGIVVGLPRSLNGDETDQTAWVRQWVNEAKAVVDAPFYWQDEALTTRLAEATAASSVKSGDLDALAAQIILQDFLDTPEVSRVIS